DFGFAADQPLEKPLQRWSVLPLVGERQSEKLLDRVLGFGAEPRKQRAPPPVRPEDPGVELVRRNEIRAVQERRQPFDDRAQGGVRCSAGAQPVPQPLIAAAMSELEQRLLVDAEERALQYGRKRQIVF